MRTVSLPSSARAAYAERSPASGPMSRTLVTPSEPACSSARVSACARRAGVRGGTTWLTSPMAASLSRPVGLPAASRTMRPPGGSGVAAVTPASFRATEFATAIWQSNRFTKTGVAGATASIS